MPARFSKNLISYSSASLLAQGLQLAQGFLLRHLLSPALMGLWNYVGVAQNTLSTFDLGVAQAAGRELPLLRGASDWQEEARVRATAYWGRAMQAVLFAATLIGFSRWLGVDGLPPMALWTAAALVLTSTSTETINGFLQCAQQYRTLSVVTVANSLISVLVLSISAWMYGLKGLLTGALITSGCQAVIAVALSRHVGVTIQWAFELGVLRRLLRFGLPFRLLDYPMSLLTVVDSLYVARFFDAPSLAIYTTARLFFAMASDVPARMGAVLVSRLYTLTGAGRDRRELGREISRYFAAQHMVVMPLLISTVAVASRVLVAALIPKYVSSVPIGEILLLAVYFIPANTLIRNFWILDGRLMPLFWSNVAGLAGMAMALLVASTLIGWNLTAVAIGVVGGYFLHFVVVTSAVGPGLWAARTWLIAARATGCCLATGIAVRLSDLAVLHSIWPPIPSEIVRWLTIQIVLLPMYLWGFRVARLGDFLPDRLQRRRSR